MGESVAATGFRIARRGARLRPGCANLDSPQLWQAAKEEWETLNPLNSSTSKQWNIYLDGDGTLRTYLSLFDDASGRVNKQEADRLFKLNGQHPMHLVMARDSRRAN